jgi:DNA-binding LytR/AlgR family response regulator
MKVVIVEDEVLSAEHLERMLQRMQVDLEVVAKLDSVKSCKNYFAQFPQVDLVFMDIHLADGNAMDFLREFPITTPIIFTTAFDQYALNAFKVNAVDYLLKPIDKTELESAIQKHLRLSSQQQNELLENIRLLTKGNTYKNRFMVKLGDSLTSLKTEEIHHFLSEDGMVLLVTNQGKRFPLDYNLDQLEQLIEPTQFFRINRKVIIRLDAIQKVASYFNSRLKIHAPHLQEDDAIVSRERVGNFKEWFS